MGEVSKASAGALPESLNEFMGPSVLKLLISDRQAGKLIGKHGSTVSQIGNSCHVAIRVSASNMFFPTTSDRVVLIGGEQANIETALHNVQERVANPMVESQTIVMLVHSSLLTSFVGTGCAHLHRVAGEFGVSINVGPKLDNLNERIVKVSHSSSSQAVIGAILALSLRIMAEPATLANLQMNYDVPFRSSSPGLGAELYLSGMTVESDGATRPAEEAADEEVHLAAASLLPFEEIKVDTDLLRGSRTAEADELICKICHTYFLGCAPKLTKCAHAFCGDCLESWIQVQPTFRSWAQVAKTAGQARLVPCPVCKTPLNDKTDIHLVFGETGDSECVKMASSLRRLPLMCHNNPCLDKTSACSWEGSYAEYQSHARVCTKNKTKTVIERNTTAPPQTHQQAGSIEREAVTVVIPYLDGGKDAIRVEAGNRVVIEERSDAGWIYVKNLSLPGEGWVPEYCSKRYDAWFEDLVSGLGKHVEKCAAIRDFDPLSDPATAGHANQFLPLREGEVFTVCERAKNGWNLVINSDGSRQGWVPDNRCKVIREGSDNPAVGDTAAASTGSAAPARTFVVRRTFEGDEKRGELTVSQGDTVSVRQAHDSGWTLGVVVAGGSRKEGWFPDWIIDRSIIDKDDACVVCSARTTDDRRCTYVRVASMGRPQDLYGPVCDKACWDQWLNKKTAPVRRR